MTGHPQPPDYDYKKTVSVSLPKSLIGEIEANRDGLSRSTFVLQLLKDALKRRQIK